MALVDALILAFQNLWRMRMRTVLTILGAVIGISAIVLFVSLGVGLQKTTSDQIANLSMLTTITVTQTPATSSMEEGPKLTQNTVKSFQNISGVKSVSPSVSLPITAVFEGTNAGAIVYGIDRVNSKLEIPVLTFGKDLGAENEIIISGALATAFTSDKASILDKKIKIKVIQETDGEVKVDEVEGTIAGIDNNDTTNTAYLDLNLVSPYLADKDSYTSLKVRADSRKSVDRVKDEIKEAGYQVTTIKDLVDQIDKIFLLAEIILGLIGGIGLLVSALGIINTMTISFLERTREIGIMKSIGASNSDIRKLFYLESGMIGLFGGLCGVLFAILIGEGVNLIINSLIEKSGQHIYLFITPWKLAAFSIALAIFIALLAGIYPTRRAQRLLPIDAIRQ